jgi:hypothetical protein
VRLQARTHARADTRAWEQACVRACVRACGRGCVHTYYVGTYVRTYVLMDKKTDALHFSVCAWLAHHALVTLLRAVQRRSNGFFFQTYFEAG